MLNLHPPSYSVPKLQLHLPLMKNSYTEPQSLATIQAKALLDAQPHKNTLQALAALLKRDMWLKENS